MISGQDIICVSTIDWDFLWQGHQEITCRFAAAGNRVLYVENIGIRSPRLHDAQRVMKRLRNWTRALRSGGVRQVAKNVYVCSPIVLPPFGSPRQREINRRFFLPLIRRAAYRLGMRDPLLWMYSPTDAALDLMRALRTAQSVVVYYCVDNFSQAATNPEMLKESELTILKESDVVFATCAELAAHCSKGNNNVGVFPFGVDLNAFPFEAPPASASENGHPPGSLLRGLSRPLIGYVGGIHKHIDFRLLADIAEQRPEWSLVLVGPVQTELSDMHGLANVHFLGPQPHDSLASYIREFNVCIVPYVNSSYTATVVPTKINEYLAMGKPVVSTNLPAVNDFNRKYQILAVSTPRSNDFLQAIEQVLAAGDDELICARRRQIAELADWRQRLEDMSQLIDAALKKRVAQS